MCYCCKVKCRKVTLGLFSAAALVPSVLLFVYGGLLKNFFSQYLGSDYGANIASTALGIVLGFAAMVFIISFLGILAACCF